jgi:hypothetical protein
MEGIKVYGVDVDMFYNESSLDKLLDDLTNEEFVEEAEKQGLVWSLKGFEKACNESEININRINIKILQN